MRTVAGPGLGVRASMGVRRREFLAAGAAMAAMPLRAWSEAMEKANEVPWLAEVQTPPAKLPADAPKLAPLLADEAGRRIESLDG